MRGGALNFIFVSPHVELVRPNAVPAGSPLALSVRKEMPFAHASFAEIFFARITLVARLVVRAHELITARADIDRVLVTVVALNRHLCR